MRACGSQLQSLGSGNCAARGLSGRQRTAWVWTVTAAAALIVALIGVFLDPVPLFGQIVLGHPNWGLLAFSAAFLIIGAAMVAITWSTASGGRHAVRDQAS